MEETEVLIIGAGVAGLFAAYELVKQNFRGTITIVEQGLSMDERISSKKRTQDTLHGVGGPGLFADGKICLDERAGTRLTGLIDDSVLRDYVTYVWRVLKRFLPEEDLHSIYEEEDLVPIQNELKRTGLQMQLSYPVVHLGSDRVRLLGQSFEGFLREHKVRFLTDMAARDITVLTDLIEVSLQRGTDNQNIRCQYLITAVGKSGHDWLSEQFKKWDIIGYPNVPDIGIRLEFPNAITQEFIKLVQNPRIVMELDNNTYIKTHCWCYGGRISTYSYLTSTIVDGETFSDSLTDYTSVNLQYHFVSDQDPVKEARALLQTISQIGHGLALRENLGTLRGDTQSDKVLEGSVDSKFFQEAQIERLFPKKIMGGFLEFIKRMDAIWPGIADSSTLVYAPVIEWDTYRLPVDENMSTPIKNIYAVGDGAGLSQGVVSAATSGLIAAKDIVKIYSGKQTPETIYGKF